MHEQDGPPDGTQRSEQTLDEFRVDVLRAVGGGVLQHPQAIDHHVAFLHEPRQRWHVEIGNRRFARMDTEGIALRRREAARGGDHPKAAAQEVVGDELADEPGRAEHQDATGGGHDGRRSKARLVDHQPENGDDRAEAGKAEQEP